MLEHVPDDDRAIAELVRVLKPGGTLAITVPRWLPEKVCWALSDDYHANEGGHIRIYRADELRDKVLGARPAADPRASRARPALAVLVAEVRCRRRRTDHPLVTAYHQLLVWDMMSRPWLTRTAESLLNPLIGKSLVLYFRKPEVPVAGCLTFPACPAS